MITSFLARWASPFAWVALVLALVSTGITYTQLQAERLAHAETKLAWSQATLAAQELARETEATLKAKAQDLQTQLAKEAENAKKNHDRLVAELRAGTQRMSIPATCPAPTGQVDTHTGFTARVTEPQRAELDPEAAATLVALAAEGDVAIRERNACITQYNQVRQLMSGD